QHFQERGLARAVAADQADTFAGIDREVRAIQQRVQPVGKRGAAQSNERHVASSVQRARIVAHFGRRGRSSTPSSSQAMSRRTVTFGSPAASEQYGTMKPTLFSGGPLLPTTLKCDVGGELS